MITYPRKCEHCSYTANNPTMYSYHKRIHEPIPETAVCHFCGERANYRNTGGKYTCTESYANCPKYLEQLAERTRKSWDGDLERKRTTKERFLAMQSDPGFWEKNKKAIQKNAILKPEDAKDYNSFARACRRKAQQWAKDNGYEIGQQTFHVDHKVSVLEGYYAGLTVDQLSHPANLQILSAADNVAKGARSSMSIDELLFRTTN